MRKVPMMTDPTDPTDELTVSLNSTAFERMAEAAFLSDLLQEMWFARRSVVDVLHSTVDAFGYDLVLWTPGVTRHVQLKTRSEGAKSARFALSAQLERLPAACVVIIEWEQLVDTSRMALTYRWFGNGPHEAIPSLGDKVAKHAKGNAQGVKLPRPGMREVAIGRFSKVATTAGLADLLFGSS